MNKQQLQQCESFLPRNVIDLDNPKKNFAIKQYVVDKTVSITHIIDKWIAKDGEYLTIINANQQSRKMYSMFKNSDELTTVADSLAYARRIMNIANGGTKKFDQCSYEDYAWRDHELQGIIGEFVFYQWHALNSKQDISITAGDIFFVSKVRLKKGANDPGDFTIVKDLLPYVIDVKASDIRTGRPALNVNVNKDYYNDVDHPGLNTNIDLYVSVQKITDTKWWIAGCVEEHNISKQRYWSSYSKNGKIVNRFYSIHLDELSDPEFLIN